MIAAAAALALSGSCTGALCNGEALQSLFGKLAHASTRPVHILQIGDSHTAGDAITGAWRELLQRRYGSAGRGVLPPGRPYDGYLTRGVTVTMSPGWRIASDFGANWSQSGPPLGLSGFTLTSLTDGASMALAADPTEMFDRLTVCGVLRPGSGTVQIAAGGENVAFELDSVSERPECRTVKLPAMTSSATLTSVGGPVALTSWATFRGSGGVTLSNLGVVGSQLQHWARTSDAVLIEELANYRPDLIVLAFGTNEGFAPRVSAFEYEVTLRAQIGRLRRIAGNVPILLLGAPDALTRREPLRANADGGPSPDCGTQPMVYWGETKGIDQTLLDRSVRRIKELIGTLNNQPDGTLQPAQPQAAPPVNTATAKTSLFPPAGLKAVRDIQRRVAAHLNVAFWDWEARMGGRCTADRWVHATPPLMRGDYVHYTRAGGQELAARLQDDLDKAAAR